MKATIFVGDCREVLATLPAESVHAVVTSPPYWGLRDYKAAGQIGLERTLAEFVSEIVAVFAEVHRVLRPDGTLWLNLGDCYNGGAGPGSKLSATQTRERDALASGFGLRERGLKPKDLCMVPHRVALALQDWGWYVRSEIVWAKKAPMPESVSDRPTSAHEKIFLLAKSERYYYDAEAVREQAVPTPVSGNGFKRPERLSFDGRGNDARWTPARGARDYAAAAERYGEGTSAARTNGSGSEAAAPGGRNMRNFWLLGPQNFPEAHFATFPEEVPRRAILAGTSEHGCCPACLAPYRRRVEPTPEYAALLGKDWADYDADATEGRGHFALGDGQTSGQRCVKRNAPSVTAAYRTVGWTPGCKCEAGEPIPCTVLDPFAGASTTLVVAGKLGRDSIGIELNPTYAEMSERRILREVGPLLVTVDVIRPTEEVPA
jgi:DNA modification methylase